MKATWRSYLVLPSLMAVGAIVGGFFGPGLTGVSAATNQNDVDSAIKTFSRVYDLVEQNFADKVSADKAVYRGAIPGRPAFSGPPIRRSVQAARTWRTW